MPAGTIGEDDDKLGQAVANMALTSFKRLVGRQAVIKTGTSRDAVWLAGAYGVANTVRLQIKRKPFNSNVADYLLIIATFAFSYPLVLSDASNICICAFAVVVPGVRFNAFATFVAPTLMQPEDSVHGA